LVNIIFNQISSHVVDVATIYYAFVENNETIRCFFEDHHTTLDPGLKT